MKKDTIVFRLEFEDETLGLKLFNSSLELLHLVDLNSQVERANSSCK